MTLARYVALVLGAAVVSLSVAWPALPAETRPAAASGALLAALNSVCAYFLALWSAGRSTSTFFTAVLGGMVARMLVLLAAVLAGVLLAGLPKVPFTVSLLSYFVAFLVLELTVLSRRRAGAPTR